MHQLSKSVAKRRPSAWVRAELEGNQWNGEILSIFPKPLEYHSLAIGLEAMPRDPWNHGAMRVTTAFATMLVSVLSCVVSWFGHHSSSATAGVGLVSVLMR